MTAIALRYAGTDPAIAFFVMGWSRFCRRFPRTAWFVFGFMRGLLGGFERPTVVASTISGCSPRSSTILALFSAENGRTNVADVRLHCDSQTICVAVKAVFR